MAVYSFKCEERPDANNSVQNEEQKTERFEDKDAAYIKDCIDYASVCFGWKVFPYEKTLNGVNQKYLVTAGILNNSEERENAENHLFCLTTYGRNIFFSRAFNKRAEEFDVFSFSCLGDEIPLKELSAETRKTCAIKIFRTLIKALYDYNCALTKNGQQYRPWGCICEDTVYIRETSNGEDSSFELQILPIFPKAENSSQLTNEIFSKDADISTDIYTIADLYFTIKGEYEDTDIDRTIKECLLTSKYKKLRPSIERLLNIEDPRSHIKEKIEIQRDDEEGYSKKKSRNPKPTRNKKGFFGALSEGVGNILNSINVDNESTLSDATVTEDTESE